MRIVGVIIIPRSAISQKAHRRVTVPTEWTMTQKGAMEEKEAKMTMNNQHNTHENLDDMGVKKNSNYSA